MNKIWLGSYPAGVPAEVQVDMFRSLPDLFAWICRTYGDMPAFTNQDTTLTWNALDELSHNFASYLRNVAGLANGDRVAVMLPNLLQYPVALFGILRAGCVVVNVNPFYTARELQHQLADSGASAIVILDNFAHTLEQAQQRTPIRHVIVTRAGDMLHFPKAQIVNLVVKHVRHMVPEWHISQAVMFADAMKQGAQAPLPAVGLGPDDTAFLQYTGGTTGVPKGAILSHGNLLANVEQVTAWISGTLAEGGETALIPLPLYHVFALTATLTLCRLGAHIVLIADPRDMPGFIRHLRHYPVSVMIGVNTLFNTLLNEPALGKVKMDGMKLVVAGGMAVQRAVAERWREVTGTRLTEGYGLTEAAPIVCANPIDRQTFSGAVGVPLPSTEVAIRDERGADLPYGQSGEICVRGPQVMRGYWNMPEETAQAFHAGGWLRTGDVGVMDEQGCIRLIDRQKDVIVVSGFKVYPNEVEDVVAMHPGVAEVAAVRAPDPHSGEAVKVVVVRRDPALTAEELLAHCSKYLTGYKVPRLVVFRDKALPKSPIGKILRRAVLAGEDDKTVASAAGT